MDRLTSMAVFAKVVEASRISAAARALGVSQATASKHVQMLENWLGARLLNRTTRRVSMTEIGESFYAQCTRILEDIDDARAASRSEAALRGTLRIAAPICFGATELGPILTGFMRLHPGVSSEVFVSDRQVDPLEDGFDLAIRLGAEPAGPGVVTRRVAAFPTVLCASPGYLKDRPAPARPEDLSTHACLLDRQLFGNAWRFVGANGAGMPRLVYRFAANNALILREAALAGAGLLLAPEFVVGDDLATGRLVRLMPDWTALPTELGVAVPASRQLSGKIRGFMAYMAERLAAS
jgi:DNA-binding transcriptional LysR family regulator